MPNGSFVFTPVNSIVVVTGNNSLERKRTTRCCRHQEGSSLIKEVTHSISCRFIEGRKTTKNPILILFICKNTFSAHFFFPLPTESDFNVGWDKKKRWRTQGTPGCWTVQSIGHRSFDLWEKRIDRERNTSQG